MSDEISTLPINKADILDPAEASRVKPFLQTTQIEQPRTFWQANKKLLLTILTFFILSVPLWDPFLTKITGNEFFTLLLKTVIFIIALIIIGKL